jgi:hypothetical protein
VMVWFAGHISVRQRDRRLRGEGKRNQKRNRTERGAAS